MQLIMIEGLPGTGKSTITHWLGECFSQKGVEVTPLLEGDERIPCDFYETAGIPLKDFYILCTENLDYSEALKRNASITEHYAYVRIENYPERIEGMLRRWDMGDESNDDVSVKEYIACALERLQHWVKNIAPQMNIVITDSGFLQNPVNELLFRKATDKEVIFFIREIFSLIKDLNPLCIYLDRGNAREAIDYAKKVKGDSWAARIDDLLWQTGCPDLFEHRFELEKQLLASIPSLICKVNDNDWTSAKKQISDYFSL